MGGRDVENTDAVEKFIAEVEWRFAKTMPQWPHWYVMKDWNPGREGEFMELVRRIFGEGRDEQWGAGKWERTVRYYFAGDFKYWVMDPTIEATDLINRARIGDTSRELDVSSEQHSESR